MLEDRLSLDDCLIEAMRDTYQTDGIPMPSDAEIASAFRQVSALLEAADLSHVTTMTTTARWVLADCYDGSTWCDRADSARACGEISEAKFRAEVRSFEQLGDKLATAGIDT